MPPKSKAKRGIAPTSNKTKGGARKKKQPDPVYSEMVETTEDEEEPSLCGMMSNMGTLLLNLTTRMESYEKRLDDRNDPATSQVVFLALPEASTSSATREQVPVRWLPATARDTIADVAEQVKARVAHRLRQVPTSYPLMDGETLSEDEEA